jgi:hypothetical protein
MFTIKTVFYTQREVVKTNSGNDANMAVARCILHMQINRYGATTAEVYDSETGELHAAIRRHMNGTITIQYKRDPAKYERRLSLWAFKEIE